MTAKPETENDLTTRQIERQPVTRVLQKSGLTAKLNVCAFNPQSHFLFALFCNLANRKNGFATFVLS
jgi:hypothetical protein